MYGATRYSLTRVISRHSTKARTTSSSMFLLRRGNATAAAASTKSEPVHPSTDLVRTAIQRMLEDQMSMSSSADSSSSEKITAQQQALESVQNQLEEVRLCIADCAEATDAVSFQEEFQTADAALEQAVLRFTDWLEDARLSASSSKSKELRETACLQIKQLRRQLDALKDQKEVGFN